MDNEGELNRYHVEGFSAIAGILALVVSILILLDNFTAVDTRAGAAAAIIFFFVGWYLLEENDRDKEKPDYQQKKNRYEGLQLGGIILAIVSAFNGTLEGSSITAGVSSITVAFWVMVFIFAILVKLKEKREAKEKAKVDPLDIPASLPSKNLSEVFP